MSSVKEETEFKRWFLKQFDGWSETYEPALGSGMGIPDVQLLTKTMGKVPMLLPIELKVGEWRGVGSRSRLYLKGEGLRPAQVQWHINFELAGGLAWIVVGVPYTYKGHWVPYALPRAGMKLMDWRKGWGAGKVRLWDIWS